MQNTQTEQSKARSPLHGLRTEYYDGAWRFATDESDPQALITYTVTPSPETGHVGWCWWALGKMGDAESYESACKAAESALQRKLAEVSR